MECSGGAATASPADSNPLGFTVDVKTGEITGTPVRATVNRDGVRVRDGYRMRLRAVDAADVRTDVAEWAFDVKEPPKFSLKHTANWTAETDSKLASKYHIAETHLLPKPRLKTDELLQHPAGSDYGQVVYLLSAKRVGHVATFGPTQQNCTTLDTERERAQVVSALTDVATGAGAINIQCEGSYAAKLVVRDGGGAEVVLRDWSFEVLRRDTDVPEYGPSGSGCTNGVAEDGEPMDKKFTCDCSATKFTGKSCEVETVAAAAASDDSDAALTAIGAVLGVLALGVLVVYLVIRYQKHQRSMMVTDFQAQLALMKADGLVDAEIPGGRVPRELKRGWLMFIDKLGQGQFGEVWKGLLSDGDNPNIPEYMVAAKTVNEITSGDESNGIFQEGVEGDLMKEALLMAQVEPHVNLVSIIGVITRGRPKTLVLSFCEHGELGGMLKKRASNGEAFSLSTKYRFCGEVAAGMAHLGTHNFIHRDLAARNVLLGTGLVCKVADFGLSRRVQTEDNTGDYYRSTSGVLPVRWTAPEGLTSQKFSAASDVWSFGITCIEVFQDGIQPYVDTTSNPAVMNLVANGEMHPQPAGCEDDCYAELTRCWNFEPEQRPGFKELREFFADLVEATPEVENTSLAAPTTEFLNLYLQGNEVGAALIDELERDGALAKNDLYNSSVYERLGEHRDSVVMKESEITGGLNGVEVSAKLSAATQELHQHSQKYDQLFGEWREDDVLIRLRGAAAALTPLLGSPYERVAQPNPWGAVEQQADCFNSASSLNSAGGSSAILTDSKRYLGRIIAVFSGAGAKYGVDFNPVDDVASACSRVMAMFGEDVELLMGPPKKEQRIMEKAVNGRYDSVRDLGRFSLLVGDIAMLPDVIGELATCPDFVVVRVKNRLDPLHDASDTAGYRDVQILVREPKGRWIVEIQIIPGAMYELKRSCGHSGYTKYRFVLEACKRAKFKTAALTVVAARSFLLAPAVGSAEGASLAVQDVDSATETVSPLSRGPCSRCGELVLVTQEREQDSNGAYFHTNAANCSAIVALLSAGTPRKKKHGSRNAVHPTDTETEA